MKKIPSITITFAPEVFEQIRVTIGTLPPENGGMLGGDYKNGVVSRFFLDKTGKRTGIAYSPDTTVINKLLDDWNSHGVRLLGFVHSHPGGFNSPSAGDEVYARRILDANPNTPYLLIPIVLPDALGGSSLHLFVAERAPNGVTVTKIPYQVLAAPTTTARITTAVKKIFVTKPPLVDLDLFARVTEAYDLDRLAQCRVIFVGTGGAAACAEDLARAGVGEFVLVDPGRVELCNLATQHFFRADVGRPKVRCLKKRLLAVNPRAKVAALVKRINDIDDARFEQLAFAPLSRSILPSHSNSRPLVTVIVGATDNFFAQARVNRLALQFGLPSVCAQNYKHGLAAEVTFTHAQVTRSCHRCILSPRYAAYLQRGFKNTVGSAGSPISATVRLNALKFLIVMAALHHDTAHARWGNLLERIGDRNLIQVRNHPDAEQNLGLTNFSEAFAGSTSGQIFFDETIWRPQTPEHPTTGCAGPCPDCGGTGDLNAVKGTIADTRELPR